MISWYRWAQIKIAGTREDFLRGQHIPEEIITFITQQPEHLANIYTSILAQKPQTTIAELQAIPIKDNNTQQQEQVRRVIDYYSRKLGEGGGGIFESPQFNNWLIKQMAKTARRLFLETGSVEPLLAPLSYFTEEKTLLTGMLISLRDWYNGMLDENKYFDINSYSIEQAIAASDRWHAYMAGRGQLMAYGPIKPHNIVFTYGKDHPGWTIQLVNTKHDLEVEGNLMDHCVGGYWKQVREGKSVIYSLRDAQNHPHVTLEVINGNQVVQIMAMHDREPDDEIKEILSQWLITTNFKWIRGDELFEDLRYEEDRYKATYIHEQIYNPDKYGLKPDILSIDTDTLYNDVLASLTHNNRENWYRRDMRDIGPVIAKLAVEQDILRLHDLLNYLQISPQMIDYAQLATRSLMQENDNHWDEFFENESLYNYYPIEEDYETKEDYEQAMQEYEEQENYNAKEVLNYLPYGLGASIVRTISELTATPEYQQLLAKVHSNINIQEKIPSKI